MKAMTTARPGPMPARSARRAGFSLIELLMALTIVGLVTGIAIPNLRSVTFRARATEVAADLEVVRVATLSFNADRNAWPGEAPQGTVPPELATYVPEGYSFADGNGYQLDFENISPVVIPGEPGTVQLIAVSVGVDNDELSAAVVNLLGGSILFSVGRKHTVLIDRS
jgi:prepilin-type N-terminal cleavage/methylation domain-containing protein